MRNVGTNFFVSNPFGASGEKVALTDDNHYPLLVKGATAPATGTYAQGAIFFNTTTGTTMFNIGTTTAPSFATSAVTTVTSLTSAQILALNTTPITLIAAPGAGYAINLISVMGSLTFATAAYATHTELDIIDATSSAVLFKDTATLLAATASKVATVPVNTNSNAGLVVTANAAVNATVATGNPATGAGTLKLYTTYNIIAL